MGETVRVGSVEEFLLKLATSTEAGAESVGGKEWCAEINPKKCWRERKKEKSEEEEEEEKVVVVVVMMISKKREKRMEKRKKEEKIECKESNEEAAEGKG